MVATVLDGNRHSYVWNKMATCNQLEEDIGAYLSKPLYYCHTVEMLRW